MLHSNDNAPKQPFTPSTLNPAAPVKTVTSPIEQATIGRTLVIKGEVSGSESLYIDGRIEGTLSFKDHRVTVGGEPDVQLDQVGPGLHGRLEGRQGVLRVARGVTSVGHHQWPSSFDKTSIESASSHCPRARRVSILRPSLSPSRRAGTTQEG